MIPGGHLHLLWTRDDEITWRELVIPYASNSLKYGWWEEVTVIVWGASVDLVRRDPAVQRDLTALIEAGVKVTACRACAENLGAAETLAKLGAEVKYWGQPLTEVLTGGGQLLTF